MKMKVARVSSQSARVLALLPQATPGPGYLHQEWRVVGLRVPVTYVNDHPSVSADISRIFPDQRSGWRGGPPEIQFASVSRPVSPIVSYRRSPRLAPCRVDEVWASFGVPFRSLSFTVMQMREMMVRPELRDELFGVDVVTYVLVLAKHASVVQVGIRMLEEEGKFEAWVCTSNDMIDGLSRILVHRPIVE
jgi:hypothetical protein